MCSAGGAQVLPERVAPFGDPRLGLLDSSPRLFAVLPRPSSAFDAKASTMCLTRLTCFRLNISFHIQLLKCSINYIRLGEQHQAACLVVNHLILLLCIFPHTTCLPLLQSEV
jgi:hypothetical protein